MYSVVWVWVVGGGVGAWGGWGVGSGVGAAVGSGVGFGVGAGVAVGVGTGVGAGDGLAVGPGCRVGAAVGAGEGDSTAEAELARPEPEPPPPFFMAWPRLLMMPSVSSAHTAQNHQRRVRGFFWPGEGEGWARSFPHFGHFGEPLGITLPQWGQYWPATSCAPQLPQAFAPFGRFAPQRGHFI